LLYYSVVPEKNTVAAEKLWQLGIYGRATGMFEQGMKRQEFEEAALPHLHEIYRSATRLLADSTKADDVVQDVYLQAWKSFDSFEVGTNCRAWLFKILFYVLHHHRRKWFNVRMVKDSEEILDQATSATPIPEHLTDKEVLDALGRVPQDFRAVVLLVDVEEFSYKDASTILSVPIGTVMSRLSRGRKLLRGQLEGLAQSYGIGKAKLEGRMA
jgi:RNA polymerase sigma-70 factor (ECF subfamily)